ncbi:hypothetical protein FTX61_19315 [Nitriliruptoraceae bacterium ZYF776]|nr:hypothetical protein [Profundirhabdus halotolerans]
MAGSGTVDLRGAGRTSAGTGRGSGAAGRAVSPTRPAACGSSARPLGLPVGPVLDGDARWVHLLAGR